MTCQVQLLRIVPQCGPMYTSLRGSLPFLILSLSLSDPAPLKLHRLLNFVPPFVSWFYNVSLGNLGSQSANLHATRDRVLLVIKPLDEPLKRL